jgi:hypothetical protein
MVLSLLFCAPQVGANVVFQMRRPNRRKRQPKVAARRVQDHVGPYNADQSTAMRLLAANTERRRNLCRSARKALVIARFEQRTIEAGRFDFESIRLVKGVQLRVEGARDSLAKRNVSASRAVEHDLQGMFAGATPCRMRNEFDAGERCIALQLFDGAFERMGQCHFFPPKNNEARDLPTLFLQKRPSVE